MTALLTQEEIDDMNARLDQINRVMVGCNRTQAFTIISELAAIAMFGFGLHKIDDPEAFLSTFLQRTMERAEVIRKEVGDDGFPDTETLQ